MRPSRTSRWWRRRSPAAAAGSRTSCSPAATSWSAWCARDAAPRPRMRSPPSRTSRGAPSGPARCAIAARCRGLLADDDAFEGPFEEALRLHREVDAPFEEARTLLCLGERLRRARRRADARVHLRAALDAFEAPRRGRLGRHRAGRAGRHGRDGRPALGPEIGCPHPAGAPGGADGRLRRDESRGRRPASSCPPRRSRRTSGGSTASSGCARGPSSPPSSPTRASVRTTCGARRRAAAPETVARRRPASRLDDVEPEVERVEVPEQRVERLGAGVGRQDALRDRVCGGHLAQRPVASVTVPPPGSGAMKPRDASSKPGGPRRARRVEGLSERLLSRSDGPGYARPVHRWQGGRTMPDAVLLDFGPAMTADLYDQINARVNPPDGRPEGLLSTAPAPPPTAAGGSSTCGTPAPRSTASSRRR